MTHDDFTPIRSFLFTPANHPRRVEKVFEVGADAVILDLEDAVAISEKPAARQCVVGCFQRPSRQWHSALRSGEQYRYAVLCRGH